ncbi:uncharacterized protein LOC131635044 [Vicia villosa]|uniref:uncharacterized protein LOC131635044 n=1 Tax=Vicia villosa TaxID=3911 RepID=UPI00273B2F87|nr:uncharacterized protein LOC131635044 [Vicia villosa]
MILTEYEIQYTTQKAIKGSVLADHLAHQAVNDYQSMNFEFPDEDIMLVNDYEEPGLDEGPEPGSRWTMVFYGASNALGNGIGVVIISPKGGHTPFTARLCFDCTNNMVEYEACIMGLKSAIDLRIKFLEVYGDSALVISQIKGEWDTKHPNLIPYKEHVLTLIPYFEEITFEHIPREENQLADALATMSSMFKVRWDNEAPMITIERLYEPAHCCEIVTKEVDEKPWFYEVKRYLEAQEYLEGESINDRKFLRRFSAKFFPKRFRTIKPKLGRRIMEPPWFLECPGIAAKSAGKIPSDSASEFAGGKVDEDEQCRRPVDYTRRTSIGPSNNFLFSLHYSWLRTRS